MEVSGISLSWHFFSTILPHLIISSCVTSCHYRKTLGERARAMAAKLLLGADVPNKMEEDGHMEYILHRPVGGHGKVYIDVSAF